MKKTTIPVYEVGLIAGTRAMLGAGLGLLLADRLLSCLRRTLGWVLFLIGILTTFPLIGDALSHRHGDCG